MALITAVTAIFLFLQTEGRRTQPTPCVGNSCYKIFKENTDFPMSLKACQNNKGNLMSVTSDLVNQALHNLLLEVKGDFWIGLQLPANTCSNTSSTLRGYEWTTKERHTQFSNWNHNLTVCSSRCVSVSSDSKWTERPCEDKVSGYICENKYDMCASGSHQRQEGSAACVVENADCEYEKISSKQKPKCLCRYSANDTAALLCRCKDGYRMAAGKCMDINECLEFPCEHKCSNIPGSYICKCRDGYIPDKKDQRKCEQHCDKDVCPAVCDRNIHSQCHCPSGYILDSTSKEMSCVIFTDSDSHTTDNISVSFGNSLRGSSTSVTLKQNVLTLPMFSVLAVIFFS